ncbi:MAG: hypothetical protein Q9219_000820 [cf. Caloplaca sp. 3 TL-2023]
MGRELQKKKNKSSIPKVKRKPKSKKLNIKANPIVAANWNQKETLSQNYRRLGLVSKLNTRTGGIEKRPSDILNPVLEDDVLAIAKKNPTALVPRTVRIERDPETGAIVKLLEDEGDDEGRRKRRGKREWNGRILRDELGEVDSEEEEEEEQQTRERQHDLPSLPVEGQGGEGVVPHLMSQAASGVVKRSPRKQSRREQEWVESLVEKYGDDVKAMVRDRKLNSMQQSEGDIARRVKLWKSRKERGS